MNNVESSLLDVSGQVLINLESGYSSVGAHVPHPEDALTRKQLNIEYLKSKNIDVLDTLPPVLAINEATLRDRLEIINRMLSLLAVAARAESLSFGEPLPVDEMNERLNLTVSDYTNFENSFLLLDNPDEQELINYSWRYEHWMG